MSDDLRRVVYFDLETGGLDCRIHPIIQVAAVVVDDTYAAVEEFERKLEFKMSSATPEALEINSYDADAWAEDAVPPRDAIRDFEVLLRRHATRTQVSRRGKKYQVAEMAGHNVATFDLPFIRRYFDLMSLFFPGSLIPLDTLQLARWWAQDPGVEIENLKLPTLAKYFGVDLGEKSHDAMVDVRANIAVAQRLVEAFTKGSAR